MTVCDWKRRFNSAAFKKLSHRPGGWAGLFTAKGCENSQKPDILFSVQQLHCPGKLKSKGHGKLSIHYCADQATIETIFRISVFANQFSLYGAVANMCEECESLHDRSGHPDVVMGQSIVLSEIKAEVLLELRPSKSNLSCATI